MPTCYRCKTDRPQEHFTQRVDDRYYRMCKHGVSEILSASRRNGTRRLHHTDTHRTCYLCVRVLPVSEFFRRSDGTDFSACKECNRHLFAQRRRARLAAAGGEYTVREWQTLLSQYDRCPGCERRWEDIPPPRDRSSVVTADHIIPVSKGGSSDISNIRPLCYSCNSRKGNRTS